MINWRSSSGSAAIVGVMGQMSAALMALPDAQLAAPLSPSLATLKDEVVTQSGERDRREEKEMRTAQIHRFCGSGIPVSQLTFQLNRYHGCGEYC